MSKGIALLLSGLAGALVAMQPPINSKLGQAIGNFAAATFSFMLGAAVLLVITVATGGTDLGGLRHVPWWYFVGGFIGAAFVATSLVAVRTLGAGGVVAATIAGQLSFSLVIDKLGLLGLPEKPLNAGRILGVLLLALGVFFVVRD